MMNFMVSECIFITSIRYTIRVRAWEVMCVTLWVVGVGVSSAGVGGGRAVS